MANVAYPDYGGECQRCADGITWFSPDGCPILLCAEHERIVADEPGWTRKEVETIEQFVRPDSDVHGPDSAGHR